LNEPLMSRFTADQKGRDSNPSIISQGRTDDNETASHEKNALSASVSGHRTRGDAIGLCEAAAAGSAAYS
jgi:hypothetical protein